MAIPHASSWPEASRCSRCRGLARRAWAAADSWRPVRRSQLRAASCVHLLPAARSGVLSGLRSPASANAHSAYRGGVPMPCGRHPFASLCATSTTTSTSRWDENAVGCLIWRRYRRLAGRHAVWMSAPGPADRPQAPRPGLPADELESSVVQQPGTGGTGGSGGPIVASRNSPVAATTGHGCGEANISATMPTRSPRLTTVPAHADSGSRPAGHPARALVSPGQRRSRPGHPPRWAPGRTT